MTVGGLRAGASARRRAYWTLARAFAPPGGGLRLGQGGWRDPPSRGRAEEYTRLFLAPRPLVYPYESMYDPAPRIMGETTLDVLRRYEAAGFEAPDWRDLPDHVALELAFVGALAGEGSPAGVRAQLAFLEDHLIRWIPPFCEGVEMSSRLPFYRTMAQQLRRLIPRDLDFIAWQAAALDDRGG